MSLWVRPPDDTGYEDTSMKEKIIKWFFHTKIGGLYLEFLLWWDYKFGDDAPFRSAPDFTVAQIVRNAQVLAYARGIKKLKVKINNLAFTKDKEEY